MLTAAALGARECDTAADAGRLGVVIACCACATACRRLKGAPLEPGRGGLEAEAAVARRGTASAGTAPPGRLDGVDAWARSLASSESSEPEPIEHSSCSRGSTPCGRPSIALITAALSGYARSATPTPSAR